MNPCHLLYIDTRDGQRNTISEVTSPYPVSHNTLNGSVLTQNGFSRTKMKLKTFFLIVEIKNYPNSCSLYYHILYKLGTFSLKTCHNLIMRILEMNWETGKDGSAYNFQNLI